MRKKASLNLSINAIVVIILAITMLGLGLGFMRNTFGGVSDQFKTVSEQMKQEMIESLRGSTEGVKLSAYEVSVPRGGESTIYIGVKNSGTGDCTHDFTTLPTIGDGIGTGDEGGSQVLTPVGIDIRAGGIEVFPMKITIDGAADPDTYPVTMELDGDCSSEKPTFYLIIE